MDCEKCTDDLTAYLDGELPEVKSLAVKAHLEDCKSCRKEYHSLELSADFVEKSARELQLDPEVWNSVRARISVLQAPKPAPGAFHWLTSNPWWSAAAAALATAALALGLWGYWNHQVAQKDLAQYMSHYIQAREEQELAHHVPPISSETRAADIDVFHPESVDNPFVDVRLSTDVNPFRSEDQ